MREWIPVEDMDDYLKEHCDENWSEQFIIKVKTPYNYLHVSTGRFHKGCWYWHENMKKISADFIVTHYQELPQP